MIDEETWERSLRRSIEIDRVLKESDIGVREEWLLYHERAGHDLILNHVPLPNTWWGCGWLYVKAFLQWIEVWPRVSVLEIWKEALVEEAKVVNLADYRKLRGQKQNQTD